MIKQALLNIFNTFKDLLVMLFLVFINARCLYDNYLVARFWGKLQIIKALPHPFCFPEQ